MGASDQSASASLIACSNRPMRSPA
jgi:hypothetical protein